VKFRPQPQCIYGFADQAGSLHEGVKTQTLFQ